MNPFGRLLGALLIAGTAVSVPSHSRAESLGAMRVGLADEDVLVKIADTGEWAPASVNMPLVEGDELWVPHESRAELQTSGGAYVRLDGGTALLVLRMDGDSFQLHLAQGNAYVLCIAPERSVLQLDTPDASVRAFGRSTFRVDVFDGETDVSVFEGSVLAESEAGTTRVRAGDMLALWTDGYAELSPLRPPDDWERWNTQRNRIVLARGDSHRHLPPELRVYAGDFETNGRWVFVREYGYCWTPRVVVIGDWAPYRHGRWVWRGGHYVWIGYEPWGWAPYHYGRWTFVERVGWCWVPPARGEVFWGPGYVGWVQTPEYVAWVPLAPRETYYGYGRYGRHSVDVTTMNVDRIRVNHVYRNVQVVNSVTVVHHTTFVTGRRAPVDGRVAGTIRENFVKRRNIVPGRPRIKPAETSYIPVVRPIPERKRPPDAVRKIDARVIRQSRPLVREPDRSALTPERRVRPLEPRREAAPRSVNERIRMREQAPPVSPRGPGDRSDGAPQRPEREIERRRPQDDPKDRRGAPEAPAAPDRRIERDRPPEPAVERRPTEGRGDGRDRSVDRDRPQGPPAGGRVLQEPPREGAPDRSMTREGERPDRPRRAPSPEAERPGPPRSAPERAEERGREPEGEAGRGQESPEKIDRSEGVRKGSGPADGSRRATPDRKKGATPNTGDSEKEEENGRPERPPRIDDRRERR